MVKIIWLPESNFTKSARAFDPRTLSIQRFETWRVLVSLQRGYQDDPSHSLQHVKVMNMWRGKETWLVCFGMACSLEWEHRMDQKAELTEVFRKYLDTADLTQPFPSFVGDGSIMASHRSNLLPINPSYYQDLYPGVVAGLEIAWPTQQKES